MRWMWAYFRILAFVGMLTTVAVAAPTQQEVLRSISENMNQRSNPNHTLALLCGMVAAILVIVLLAYRNKHKAAPKAFNHQGKLLKEVGRALGMRKRERDRLKRHAQHISESLPAPLSSPVVLLICPSLVKAATREAPGPK